MQRCSMLTYNQYRLLSLLPSNASDAARVVGMTASQAGTTLHRLEGKSVRSHYIGFKRVFALTAEGKRQLAKAGEIYKG